MVFPEQVWVSGFECSHLSTQQSNACRLPSLRLLHSEEDSREPGTDGQTHTNPSWAAVVSQHHHGLCNWCYPGRTVVAPGAERGGQHQNGSGPRAASSRENTALWAHRLGSGIFQVGTGDEEEPGKFTDGSRPAAEKPALGLRGRPERKP